MSVEETEQKVKRKKRASPRTIRRRKADAAVARAEREARRAEREQKRAEAERLDREAGQRRYDAQVAIEINRVFEREKSEKLVRWWMWSETGDQQYYDAETQWYEDEYRKLKATVLEAKRRAKIAGDPTNLTGHTKKPTEKELRRQARDQRLANGIRKHLMPDSENPQKPRYVDIAAHSFHNLPDVDDKKTKKEDDPGKAARHVAAERFRTNFNLAHFNGLRSSQFDERVDSSGTGGGLSDAVLQAVDHLKEVKRYIGLRMYEIIEVRVGLEVSSEAFRESGGTDHRSNNIDLVIALNALVAFYGGDQPIDRNWGAAREIKRKNKIRSWRSSE